MASLDTLRALVDPSAPDEWYVTDGASAVGPVTLELLARGVAAGRVPADAFVRHASWEEWRGLGDLDRHDPEFDPRRSFRVLPAVKPPRPEVRPVRETLPSIDVIEDVEEVPPAAAPSPPRPPMGRGPFDVATDLAEALLLLLATVVEQCAADAALVHRARGEKDAVVVCSHGPRMFELLGEAMPQGDPVLFAARQGQTVFAEPVSGVGGRAMKARLSRLGAKAESAFMVPVHVDGKLLALVEAGRSTPFRAYDVAAVERLVELLVDTIARTKWPREWKAPPPSSPPSSPGPASKPPAIAAPPSRPSSSPSPPSRPSSAAPPSKPAGLKPPSKPSR